MSWRETLGVIHSPETSYTQNTHNTQKPTGQGICADIADSAYRGSKQKATLLSPSDESRIRAWLDYIEEDDPEAIEEVIEKCRLDMEARRYFLGRAEEVPGQERRLAVSDHEWVACGDCIHFKRIDHPHLGHCAKGEPEAPAGLWDSDRRYCGNYAPSE